MVSMTQARAQDSEAAFLDGLRARYEAEGFAFVCPPDRSAIPPFLGSYLPDALARKPGLSIAIEVKRRQSLAPQNELQKIKQLFDGHPDWQLNVVYMGSGPLQAVTIPKAEPAIIRKRMDEIRSLSKRGHQRPAFVMAWSLLEAALQYVDTGKAGRPYTPGTVVQTLATKGYIDPAMERGMRALIDMRNRIVHGDVEAEPAAGDVKLVLDAINATMENGATA